jgi:hypothetical protein
MAETFNKENLPTLIALLVREIGQPAPTKILKAGMFGTFYGRPRLSYGPSQEVPCFTGAVSVAYTKNLGRHLVANRNIKIGKIIILKS